MKFFIDAGHNDHGPDTGAQGFGLREQDITWQIAERVAQKLLALGQQVKLSRPNKTDVLGTDLNSSLAARANLSNAFGADYCISIHCNAGGGTGPEVYYYKGNSAMAKFAAIVSGKIADKFNLRNRGAKDNSLYMTSRPKAPAILIETAFIDHPTDNELLRTRQEDFADAIVAGICEYTGIEGDGKKMSKNEQMTLIKQKAGLSDETMVYLDSYIFRDSLIEKLAEAMK